MKGWVAVAAIDLQDTPDTTYEKLNIFNESVTTRAQGVF